MDQCIQLISPSPRIESSFPMTNNGHIRANKATFKTLVKNVGIITVKHLTGVNSHYK